MIAAQLSTFRIADRMFGLDVARVQEALRFQPLTRVPLAPDLVGGLINLRGQIVTAVDLRRRLGFAPRPAGARPMNLIVRGTEGPTSLLVDEIDEVISVDPASVEPVPDTLSGPARELLTCVVQRQGRLVLVLDADRAVHLGHEGEPTDHLGWRAGA
jgi:purine-binding chemotaxis protein CheW